MTELRSILILSNGNDCNVASEKYPVLNSSIAMRTPIALMDLMISSVNT